MYVYANAPIAPLPIMAIVLLLSIPPDIIANFLPNMVIVQKRNKMEKELLSADMEFTIMAAFSGLAKAENSLPSIIKKGAPGG